MPVGILRDLVTGLAISSIGDIVVSFLTTGSICLLACSPAAIFSIGISGGPWSIWL